LISSPLVKDAMLVVFADNGGLISGRMGTSTLLEVGTAQPCQRDHQLFGSSTVSTT
jgi:hypothetical protein